MARQKKLYVALSGASAQANRAMLAARYLDASNNARVFVYGGTLGLHGIDLDGVQAWADPYNNAGAWVFSTLWFSNGKCLWSPAYGFQCDSGSALYVSGARIHASTSDGMNCDSTRNGNGAAAIGLMAGSMVTAAGDVDYFGTGTVSNCQAVSSHSGYLAAFGNVFSHNWGQEVADTSLGAGLNESWYVGCVAYNGDVRLSPGRLGFGFYGNATSGSTSNRRAWLDTCWASGEDNAPLALDALALAKTFNCTFGNPPVLTNGSSAPLAYAPETP